jgi:hypothetical protein
MMQGVCYIWLNRLKDAEKTLRQSYKEYETSKGDTAFYLAFLMEKKKSLSEAKKFYKIASENPHHYRWVIEQSKQRLKELEQKDKKGGSSEKNN